MGDATTVDAVVFVVSALIVLAGAAGVIISRNPIHSALSLVATLFGIAVLFVAQEAHFLAAVQVIVYAGAIVVLFLFVIMLLGVDREEDLRTDRLPGQRVAAVLVGVLGLGGLVALWALDTLQVTGRAGEPGLRVTEGSNIAVIAESLFSRYLIAFEITSVLLVIAVVGAVVLARKSQERVVDLPEASAEAEGAAS